MQDQAARILSEALQLPPEARAAIADSLLESLDAAVEPGAETAWQAEVRERIARIDLGVTQTAPWFEAREKILGG